MGCHPKALQRIQEILRQHPTDDMLDMWIDYTTRATEWDADQWGFESRWMYEERAAMERRIRGEA